MKSIHFHCPNCNQSIEAPKEIVGQPVTCPTCQHDFTAPERAHGDRLIATFVRAAVVGASFVLLIAVALVVISKVRTHGQIDAPRQPITGAFGFKLGEPPADFSEVETNTDGELYILRLDDTNAPPFGNVSVTLTPDGRVYRIDGMAVGSTLRDFYGQSDALKKVLRERYGMKRWLRDGDTFRYYFGDEKREATFETHFKTESLLITYEDLALARDTWDAKKHREEAKARKSASGL